MVRARLPERYRRAFRIEADYEIHVTAPEDMWLEVVKVLRIYSPTNTIRFDLVDKSAVVEHPQTEIMSRRVRRTVAAQGFDADTNERADRVRAVRQALDTPTGPNRNTLRKQGARP